MRFLLTSHGSTGDIYPFIALGKTLRERGHEVTLATVTLFQDEIERAGLQFLRLPPDWPQERFNEAMRRLTKARHNVDTLRIIYRQTTPYIEEVIATLREGLKGCDLFLSSYLFPQYRFLAEQEGCPFAVLTLCHNVVPSRAYSPLPQLQAPRWFLPPLRGLWHDLLWRLGDFIVTRELNRITRPVIKQIGYPPFKNWIMNPADLSLVAVSPALFEPRAPFRKDFIFGGYVRWQSAPDDNSISRVREFCTGEKVPILTFGSVTFDNVPKIMERFIRHWPKDKKLIIQSGWAEMKPAEPRENILVVDKMSHDALFPFASVVIHHGGAGTTATALHAGRPQIIVPHIADQPFWAATVKALGVGLEQSRRRWPEQIAKKVERIESDPKWMQEAKVVADILSEEPGAERCAAILERFAESRRYLPPVAAPLDSPV